MSDDRRPNVLLILMDDMGFSDPGCYGGEIETPNLDGLARDGVRFSQCYNTGRCWPTRASILTGYYAPQVHMDPPGPTPYRPSWQRLLPQYLRQCGYRSYHSGKWHINNVRDPQQDGGFDISWGFNIQQGKHFFDTESGKRFSSTAITDHALGCMRDHAENHSDAPFFQYVAYTAPHFPLHAEPGDIAKYLSRYDEGWDVLRQRRWERLRETGIVNCALSDREPDVGAPWWTPEFGKRYGPGELEHPIAWDALNDRQRRFQATKMAIHAAMVDRTDREIGRLLDQLRATGAFDDTLILFLSDNGASAEILIRAGGHDPQASPGSEATHLCLGPGWSTCSNAPFRRHKIWVHEGGVSTPLIAHLPADMRDAAGRGVLRHDVAHCVDFLPTILDLAGMGPGEIPQPADAPPLPGESLRPALEGGPTVQRSHVYFHHSGNRALRVGDWKIVSGNTSPNGEENDAWSLYDLSTDRCEMVNLAEKQPERLEQMKGLWQKYEAAYRRQGMPEGNSSA